VAGKINQSINQSITQSINQSINQDEFIAERRARQPVTCHYQSLDLLPNP
jgi:hypothetical protein